MVTREAAGKWEEIELAWRRLLIDQINALWEAGGLTLTGGNLSLRLGDGFIITPRFASSRLRWKLSPDDLVMVGLGGEVEALSGGEASREVLMHGAVYRQLEEVRGVCHTHATSSLTFAVEGKPIPLVGEYRCYFAFPEVNLTHHYPSQSQELAEEVARMLAGGWQVGVLATACLIPHHGLVVAVTEATMLAAVVMAVEQSAQVALGRKVLRG